MNKLAKHTKVNTRHMVIDPTRKTDPRNKGISAENFERFVKASDKALKRNIDANRAAYDNNIGKWTGDQRIEVMQAIGTAIAILESRGIHYNGLTQQPVNPRTCDHTDHDSNGRCYSCGGYFAAGDVSGLMR